MKCPYCGEDAKFLTSKEFYGKDYGSNIYSCTPCDAYVGTHGKGKTALGTMAKRETREMRKRAHSLFDPLWRGRKMSRSGAYRWLQQTMGLSSKEAHIGLFDKSQCEYLIIKLKEYRGIKQ